MPPDNHDRASRLAVLACVLLSFCVVLTGCDKPKNKQPAATTAPTKKLSGLSIGDKPVKLESVLALRTKGESAWRIHIATMKLSCKSLEQAFPDRPANIRGHLIDFWLAQPLLADGTRDRWSVRAATISDGSPKRELLVRGAILDGVEAAAASLRISGLELALQDSHSGEQFIYSGKLTARNCGEVARPEQARPQKALSLKVAGESWQVQGASVRSLGDKHYLRLSRAPHDCAVAEAEGYDVHLDLALRGSPAQLQFAALLGDAFPSTPSGSKGRDGFKLKHDASLDGSSELEEVGFELDGTLDLSGYRVVIAGALKALRCPALAPTGAPQRGTE